MRYYRPCIALLLALSATVCFTAGLQIQVNQATIDLPFWPTASKDPMGAVLLINGGSEHLSAMMEKTAKDLSSLGWSVAVLDFNQQSAAPLNQKIPKALSTLRKKNNKRIILIHYGDQVQKSMNYFSRPQAKQVNGMVLLSAYNLKKAGSLPSLRFPLLDIVGQFDYERVLTQMKSREKNYRNKPYLAMILPGARHDYLYQGKLLSYYLHGWMSKLPVPDTSRHPLSVSVKQTSMMPAF